MRMFMVSGCNTNGLDGSLSGSASRGIAAHVWIQCCFAAIWATDQLQGRGIVEI